MNHRACRYSLYIIKKERKDKRLYGAEVGVHLGLNALSFLRYLPLQCLYLVDPYNNYEGFDGDFHENFYTTRKQASHILKKYENTIVWIRDFSANAVKRIPDTSLDFVYIDGNHLYKWVKRDMELWYPKLKNGGILCGHDYNIFDVSRAVVEFAKKLGIKPLLGGYPIDWSIKKPSKQ